MSYLEKLLTIYVTAQLGYMVIAIFRDIKTIRINTLCRAFDNEKKTLIENIEVERNKYERCKKELKELFDTLLKERLENNKKENQKP